MDNPRCYALYTSYIRFAEDFAAIRGGAFFAPLEENQPPVYSKLEVRFHLPDGMRFDLEGEVLQSIPGRGVTIGFQPGQPALDAIAQAVARNNYQERMQTETKPGASPSVGFTDPTRTVPTNMPTDMTDAIRDRLSQLAQGKPDSSTD